MTPAAGSGMRFELRRFTAVPVDADVAVVVLAGRFEGRAAREGRFARTPRLHVETADGEALELPPLSAAHDEAGWRATFAVPAGALHGGAFALAARSLLLDLPAPDVGGGDDRLAALAREANRLRRALEVAHEELTAAEADARAARGEAARARAETAAAVAAAREAADTEATGRAEAAQRALTEARDEAAAALREAQAREEAAQAREDEALALAQEAESAAEARGREAEAAGRARATELEALLETARAQLEDAHREARELRKQLQRARADAEAQRRASRTPHRPEGPRAPAAPAGEEPPGEPSTEPAAVTVEDLRRSGALPEPADGGGESVRVLGRPPRGIDPLPPLPDGTVPLPAGSPAARWIAVALIVLFVIVLALLLGFL